MLHIQSLNRWLSTLVCGLALLLAMPESSLAQPVVEPAVPTLASPEADSPVETPAAVEVPFVMPREHHPWARFQPFAWRGLRTTTETFDAEGNVASRTVSTQVEVLRAVDESSYTLDTQVTVDLGGKRLMGKWQTRQLGLLTDNTYRMVSSRVLAETKWKLDDRELDCAMTEQQLRDQQHHLVQRLCYTPEQSPYVLFREITEVPAEDSEESRWSQTDRVVTLEVPYAMGEQVFSCSCTKSVRTSNKGTTQRMTLETDDVPGGVVAAWSTDTDAEGKRARWSLTELIDYGEADIQDRSDRKQRRELRRTRRRS